MSMIHQVSRSRGNVRDLNQIDVPPPFTLRRFTVEEYHELADAGILQSGDPYELLDGWIVTKMTRKPPHDVCIDLLRELLGEHLPRGWRPRVQSAITLSTSEPEPDAAVVRGAARDYTRRHPGPDDIALVIEVADTSLARDRYKASLYARDGIPRYWLVNLIDRVVEDYSQPTGKGTTAKYRKTEIVPAAGELSLKLGRTALAITVADILP
jgi:Uma2 family endonuclease